MESILAESNDTFTPNTDRSADFELAEQLAENREALTESEQKLLEAMAFPEDLQADWHNRFNKLIQDTTNACVSTFDQELITSVASAIEWKWFARPNDPLPDGVILTDRGILTSNTETVRKYESDIKSYLQNIVLNDLIVERNEFFDKYMMEDVLNTLGEIVRQTPAYEFLHSLASDVPEARDIPLTLAQRMIRESQEEDFVRRTHGLQPRESLRTHHGAYSNLQRRLYSLDDERMRSDEQVESDPKQRLRDYIIEHINDYRYSLEYKDYSEDNPIVELCKSKKDGLIGVTKSGEATYLGDDIYETSNRWISLPEQNGERTLEHHDGSWNLLSKLAHLLVDKEHEHLSVLEILEMASRPEDHYFIFEDGAFRPRLTAYLHQLDTPIYKEEYKPSKQWSPRSNVLDSVRVHSLESLQMSMNETLGEISGGDYSRSIGRVITGVRRPRDTYPEHVNDYNLLLHIKKDSEWFMYYYDSGLMADLDPEDTQPNIAGYEAVAYDARDSVWYFRRSETDPYRGSSEVVINDQHRENLINELTNIGMGKMAHELADINDLDLAKLVQITQEYSDYTFVEKYNLRISESYQYADFAKLVDETGRLQVQCTGAASFLRHILRTALPDSPTTILTGNMIRPNGDVPYIGHVQVIVSHEGNQYIIDSTPPSLVGGGALGGVSDISSSFGRRNSRSDRTNHHYNPDKEVKEDTTPEPIGNNIELIAQERIKQSENVAERTISLFKAHFNLPTNAKNDELYKQTLSLKKGADPIRRTLSLVLRHQNEQNISAELEDEIIYVQSLIDANPGIVRKLGIPEYNKTFLRSILRSVQDLALHKDLSEIA